MPCPSINTLPPASPEKKGWPWTECPDPDPVNDTDGHPWPLISIVTPSLNQGPFLEETIRSVLLQGYPRLEYIVIDGGSMDDSVDIIKKYDQWLTYWVSEPDGGQAQALNKGFAGAGGDILAYINSDDTYEPGAFIHAARILKDNPDAGLLAGSCLIYSTGGKQRVFQPAWPQSLDYYVSGTYCSTFAQPAAFWKRSAFEAVGGFDESLHYCFDRDFFLRLGLAGVRPVLTDRRLARFREHGHSKTVRQGIGFHQDALVVLEKHARACGVPPSRQRLIAETINIDMRYEAVFERWRGQGRLPALWTFCKMLRAYPAALKQRKVLGQARRLLTFRSTDVEALKR